MIAVILFFVVIIATAILLGNWATNLDKKEKKYKADLLDLSMKYGKLRTKQAHLEAKEESVNKKQKDADDAWQKCLEEGNRLMEKQHELEAREAEIEKREKELKDKKADVSIREAILGFMGVPEAQDIIEPVEEPQKVAFGTTEKKRCPRCGKDMEMKTDVCYTSIPPQYKYICPECGYEEVDTCPPTHNLVGTDKKPVKKARKGGKK